MKRLSEHYFMDWLSIAALRPHKLGPILFWRLLGKRVRARGRMAAAVAGLPLTMARVMNESGEADLAALATLGPGEQTSGLCIHLHLAPSDKPRAIRAAINSIAKQSDKPQRVFVTCEPGAPSPQAIPAHFTLIGSDFVSRFEGLRAALGAAHSIGAAWLAPCTPSARLTKHGVAAYRVAFADWTQSLQTAVFYGDTVEAGPRVLGKRYWLKPKWDQRMFLSQDYVTGGCTLAVQLALAACEATPEKPVRSLYDLVLLLAQEHPVEHLERVVAQRQQGNWLCADEARIEALQRVLGGKARVSEGEFGTARIQWARPEPLPTVSVIVATRDRVELLRTCVEGVLYGTDYAALELIIVDNESVEVETLAYLDKVATDPRVRVVRWPHPFNYSAINNFAARHAKGEYLCLLNNDIEVLGPEWLDEMVREARQPGVGAVGARLLYPDRSIQHAGVAIGIGNAAGHAHRALPEGEPGYYAQASIARGASAVTAACLVISNAHFDAVGGLDEEGLAVAYNDVDLCLKLRDIGLTNIYTPHATLIHHESKSRGLDFAPEHLERYMRELKVFQKRWETTCVVDPWHHALLDRASERYSL